VLFSPKSFCQSQNVTREKLHKALLYEKRVRKMLIKLGPGVEDNGNGEDDEG